MTYYCAECVMNWHPYQCVEGCCPSCGRGTKRTYDPASTDADIRHRAALARAIKRERYERFEAYYAEREIKLNGSDGSVVAESHQPS